MVVAVARCRVWMDVKHVFYVGYLRENTEDHGHRINRKNIWALLFNNVKQIKRDYETQVQIIEQWCHLKQAWSAECNILRTEVVSYTEFPVNRTALEMYNCLGWQRQNAMFPTFNKGSGAAACSSWPTLLNRSPSAPHVGLRWALHRRPAPWPDPDASGCFPA